MMFRASVVVALLMLASGAFSLPTSLPYPSRCFRWCGTPPFLTCCDNDPPKPTCTIDLRPDGNCAPPQGAASGGSGFISGPDPCNYDSECGTRAICCYDRCLQYKKCTNY
uniref:Antimicrobial peptide type 1 n=1 Tax=Pandalus japonicus TaxID=666362 RepID=I7AJA7_PANJP|nr:antimicrobial peptide type 1 precursor [Pandalus japonicus]